MTPTKVKLLFIGAICFTLWGACNMASAAYRALAWEKTTGTVVDLERNTWSCGKGIGECYSLIVGYNAGSDGFTVLSRKKFNRDRPRHLLNSKVVVYYAPQQPAQAVLGGAYGPLNYGISLFLVGVVALFVFWMLRNRAR